MTEPPCDERQVAESESIVGVRLVGVGDISFCVSGPAVHSPGDWVVVTCSDGNRFGRIAIREHLLKGSLGDVRCRVLRAAEPGEVMISANGDPSPTAANIPGFQFGSTGLAAVLPGDLSDPAHPGSSLSMEDARFRAAKSDLPRLGQNVVTRLGAASVIAVNVKIKSVTCRLDLDGTELVEVAADLTW